MYNLKNYMEDVVVRVAAEYIAQAEMCTCEKCTLDVMALALNELPTAYVVTQKGELFAAVDSIYLQNRIDVEVAVLKAVAIVKANPKH
jgi:competence protein ComFB